MLGGALALSLEDGSLGLSTPGLADCESQGRPEPGSQDQSEDRGLSVMGERRGVAMGVVSCEM